MLPRPRRPYCVSNEIFQNSTKYQKSYLIDSSHNSSHGGIPRSINRFTIVSWSPASTVDVNQIWLMSHRIRLNQIGHVGLVQHSDTGHFGIVRHSNTADSIITFGGHLPSTSCTMAAIKAKTFGNQKNLIDKKKESHQPIEPIVSVTRIWKRIVAAEIVTGFCILKKFQNSKVNTRSKQVNNGCLHN